MLFVEIVTKPKEHVVKYKERLRKLRFGDLSYPVLLWGPAADRYKLLYSTGKPLEA